MQSGNTDNIPKTGPRAIEYALAHTSIEDIENRAKKDLATGKKTKRSNAVALLNIARGLKRNELTPSDLMIHSIPVIPPKFRPFAAQGDSLIPGDANVLYKDFIDINDAYEDERKVFGDENVGKSRLSVYDAAKSLYGYADPVKPKTKAKDVKGFLKKITGKTAKMSFYQSKMIAKTQDNVGRSTITVNPDLGIDEIELPEDMAFTMYAPYIQRALKQKGLSDSEALKHTKERTKYARFALDQVMQERPVIYSRAPAWHSHSVQAAYAKVHSGKEIRTNPYVAKGLGADYDGDSQRADIIVAIPMDVVNSNLSKFKHIASYKLSAEYINKLSIPYISSHYIYAIDIADFPHNELNNTIYGRHGIIDYFNIFSDIQVLAINPCTNCIEWKEVSYWSIHPDRDVVIVDLTNDYQLFTDDDPRAVYGLSKYTRSLVPERFSPKAALEQEVFVPIYKNNCIRNTYEANNNIIYSDHLDELICEHNRLPALYMFRDKESRAALLAYIIDRKESSFRTLSSGALNVVFACDSLKLCRDIKNLARSLGVKANVHYYKEANKFDVCLDVLSIPSLCINNIWNTLKKGIIVSYKSGKYKYTDEKSDTIFIANSVAYYLLGILHKLNKKYNVYSYIHIIKKAYKEGCVYRNDGINIISFIQNTDPSSLTDPDIDTWIKKFLYNETITWEKVIAITNTDIVETGYDLTVPGYETFMSIDGIIMSNTINVHVPSGDAAVAEAKEKLMPSLTPFSDRIPGKIVPLPKQEQILGLYTAATEPDIGRYSFMSEAEAIDAIRRRKVPLSADIEIVGSTKEASSSPDNSKADNKKKALLDDIKFVKDPRTGKFMNLERSLQKEQEVKEASTNVLVTLKDVKTLLKGKKYSEIKFYAKDDSTLQDSIKKFNEGNIKPIMLLFRKYRDKLNNSLFSYPKDLWVIGIGSIECKKHNS